MSVSDPQTLRLGFSPCPNDTFIFHALLHGGVPAPLPLQPHIADVEELNTLARRGALDVTKVSLGVVPWIMENYALLSAGAALGCGCTRWWRARACPRGLAHASLWLFGAMTTANLLLTLHGGFHGSRRAMLFSEVMPAVARGEADMGLVIHEGRFTYERLGLVKVLDLGQWWEKEYHLPLPLGAIAVRRDLPHPVALALQEAIAASLARAQAAPEATREFVRAHAHRMEQAVTEAHIKTFVTEFSLDLGTAGRAAINNLVGRAAVLQGKRLPADGLFLSEE